MIICIIIIIILLAVIATLVYRYQKEIEKLKNDGMRNDILLEEYIALVKLYLEKDTFELIKTNEVINKLLQPINEKANFQLQSVMSFMVANGSKEELLAFVNLNDLLERMGNKKRISYDFYGKVNGWCRVEFLIEDRSRKEVLFCVREIEDDKLRENHLKFLTENDALSGLHNETFGISRIQDKINNNIAGMLCLIEVDKFKALNDNYGSQAGDRIIVEVASCMKDVFKDHEIVFRRGGARFAAYLVNLQDKQDGRFIMKLLESQISAIPMDDIKLSISAGVAFYRPEEKITYDQLLARAEGCLATSRDIDGVSISYYD